MIDEIIIHVFVLKQIENDHTQWKEKDIYDISHSIVHTRAQRSINQLRRQGNAVRWGHTHSLYSPDIACTLGSCRVGCVPHANNILHPIHRSTPLVDKDRIDSILSRFSFGCHPYYGSFSVYSLSQFLNTNPPCYANISSKFEFINTCNLI